MSKQKSIFVSALLIVLLVSLIAMMYAIDRTAFFTIVELFAIVGLLTCSVAFCKWLERPSDEEEATVEPHEVVKGEEIYDFNTIIDEVKRDAKIEEE